VGGIAAHAAPAAARPALLNRPACLRLRAAALDPLRARSSLDLAPPADWRREARMSCHGEHCLALSRFLQSADQEVRRFKAREADRRHVEDSIRQGRHDVDCSTERKGSRTCWCAPRTRRAASGGSRNDGPTSTI